jgi:RNA polymerase sigma-70 factor (ECF subfamily)
MTAPIFEARVERQARLERMIQANYRFIWRLLRRLGTPSHGVDDAVQQVFLVAAERVDDIRAESERAFLYGTAVRLTQTDRRHRARESGLEEPDLRPSQLPGPEELSEQKQARDLLDRVLGEMPLEVRTVFVLFELEGMTSPEIASTTDIPLGTVASRLRRGRELFRELVLRHTTTKGQS